MRTTQGPIVATEPYLYRVHQLTGSLDGDSFRLLLDVTPDTDRRYYTRPQGFDTPEKRKPASAYEIREAFRAQAAAREFLLGPGQLWCRLTGKQTFNRDLVDLFHEIDGIRTDLAEHLLDAGLATRWPTRWYQVYDPERNRIE